MDKPKTKIQVFIADDLLNKIDCYADKMGVSRSAFCAVMLGQTVMSLDNAVTLSNKLALDIIKGKEVL